MENLNTLLKECVFDDNTKSLNLIFVDVITNEEETIDIHCTSFVDIKEEEN